MVGHPGKGDLVFREKCCVCGEERLWPVMLFEAFAVLEMSENPVEVPKMRGRQR